MADTVEVTLAVNDQITGPADRAAQALRRFGDTAKQVGTDGASLQGAADRASSSLGALEGLASHRFQHVGMNIIIGQAAALSGASGTASAAVRLLEGGLFAVASTAGVLSGGLAIVVVGVAALAAAFQASSKSAEEEKKKIEELNQQLEQFYNQQEKVSAAGRRAAALMANEQAEAVHKLEQKIVELTGKIADSNKTSAFHEILVGLTEAHPKLAALTLASQHYSNKASAGEKAYREELVRTQAQLEMMQAQLKKTADLAKGQSDAAVKAQETASKEAQRVAKQRAEIGLQEVSKERQTSTMLQSIFGLREQAHLQSLQKQLAAVRAYATQHQNVAIEAAKKEVEIQDQINKQKQTIQDAGIKAAWDNTDKLMAASASYLTSETSHNKSLGGLAIAFIMMQQAMAIASVLSKGAAQGGLIGFISSAASIGMIAMQFAQQISAVKAAQKAAGKSGEAAAGSVSAGAAASAAGGSSQIPSGSSSGVAVGSSSGGGGGNSITINMPVQALDLASISDMQLKSLATRLGSILRDAAASGQFSLA